MSKCVLKTQPKTLKAADEKLRTISQAIATYTMIVHGVHSIGNSPIPKMHSHFLEKMSKTPSDSCVSKSILKKVASLFGPTKHSSSFRTNLITEIEKEIKLLETHFSKLKGVRSEMVVIVHDTQAKAILHNAKRLGSGDPKKEKSYIKKAAKQFNLCSHASLSKFM